MSKTVEVQDVAWGTQDEGHLHNDMLAKIVPAILALYLLPAFAIVMIVDGLMMGILGVIRLGMLAARCLGLTNRAANRVPAVQREPGLDATDNLENSSYPA